MTATPPSPPSTFDYCLPSLGADMDEGRIVEWRVAVGDAVHRGDVMAVVETEKSDIDIEIWHDGVVDELLVEVGVPLDVGTPIVRLRGDSSATPTPGTAAVSDERPRPVERSQQPASPTPGTDVAAGRGNESGRVRASPKARRVAAERDLDLRTHPGSGPGGAVLSTDLPDAGEPTTPQTASPPGAGQRSTSMRSLIAERMARANRDIPHYHLARDVETGRLLDHLAAVNAERSVAERVLPAAAYVRAIALAARRHPELNGFWVDDSFEPGPAVNVAMAISLRRGGLVTPHVAAADERSVDEIMATLNELVAAARRGKLRSSWMTGSTITLTSLGDTGADLVHGVISPPQVALVGIGRTRSTPWVVEDQGRELVAVRPITTITLAADHRATDGATGSRFLTTLAHLIEHPEEL